jgi:hypothetical protein
MKPGFEFSVIKSWNKNSENDQETKSSQNSPEFLPSANQVS